MASPFPGMDPYLEERALWPDVHQRMITYIAEVLRPQTRPKYIARIGERIQLADVGHGAVLDLPAVFSRCYDVGGYDLLIDYSRPPAVLLRDEETAWLANLLQEKGLRQPSS